MRAAGSPAGTPSITTAPLEEVEPLLEPEEEEEPLVPEDPEDEVEDDALVESPSSLHEAVARTRPAMEPKPRMKIRTCFESMDPTT